MDVSKLLLDLADKVAKGQISLDDAVAEVHSQRIKDRLDENVVVKLCVLAESLTNQFPPLAYYLATLVYEVAKVIKNRFLQGYSAFTLANLSFRLARYSQATELYQEALTVFKEGNNKQAVEATLGNLGNVYLSLGQYQKAIDYYEDALKIAQKIGDRDGEGKSLGNLGNAYNLLGQYLKAIDYSEQALKISQEIGDRSSEGKWLGNLGIAYLSLGQYQKAIDYFEKAREIAKEIGDKQGEGNRLGNLGIAYRFLGQYQKAIDYYKKALKIAQEIGNKRGEGKSLGNLGDTYCSLGQYRKAIDYSKKALKIAQEIEDRQGKGKWLSNLGIAYFSLGQYRNAIDSFKDALKIAQEIGDRDSEGKWLGNLGIAYCSLAQFKKAIDYYEKALKIAKEIGDVDGERIINLNLGIVYDDHSSEPEKAYGHYRRSIELSELMRGGLIEESHKIGFFGRIEDAYNRMVSLCYKLKKETEAYEYTERAKSRAFLDLLATTEIKPSVDLPVELKQKEGEYLGLLRQVQRRDYFGETVPKPQVDILKVAKELERIYDQIEKYDPEYAFLRRGRPLSLNQIQELLKAQGRRTVLVEYFVAKERILIFVLRSDDSELHIEEKSISGESLYRYIESYWREVANYSHYGDIGQTWQELSQYLIEPITKYLKNGDMIYIIPHRLLHYLPLHALKYNGKYLIEDFEIVYSPSASLIKFCQRKRHPEKGRALIFGNPTLDLKFAEKEAEEVARLFNTKPYIGTEATKDKIKSASANVDVIHLACHGKFESERPMSSYVKLADGKLTSQEIFDLRFKANLIVLSACETGISKISSGDELIGLTRSFIYAGTPSLIASLWEVNDASTSRLMIDFYKNWKGNDQSKVEALRDAQLKLMKDPRYTHPFYWAPFILVGDWR